MYKSLIRILFLMLAICIFAPSVVYAIPKNSDKDLNNRVVLKRNRVKGKNTLTQSMIDKPNTTYIIRRDYYLDSDIIIPANCTLEFKRGSLCGASIKGNNTRIISRVRKIFGPNTILDGSWDVETAYPEWFGAKGDGISDDTRSIQQILDAGFQHVFFNAGTYLIRGYQQNSGSPVQPGFMGIKIRSNTNVQLHTDAILKVIPVESEYYVIVDISGVENVSFMGGKIQGDRHTEHGEWGYGINITNSKNILIDGVKVYDCLGDGISFNGRNTAIYPARNTTYDAVVRNCEVYNCRRLALAIAGAERLIVDSCKFINTHGTEPQCAIDIELDIIPGSNKDIEIKNCFMQGNAKGIIWGRGNHENIYIHDCTIDGVRLGKYPIHNFRFDSNVITGNFSSERGEASNVIEINKCDINNLAGGSAYKIIFNNCNIKSKAINFGYQETYAVFNECTIDINNDADNVSINAAVLELNHCKVSISGTSYHLINSNDLVADNSSVVSSAQMTRYAVPIKVTNSVYLKGFQISSLYGNPSNFILLDTNGKAEVNNCYFESIGDKKAEFIFKSANGKTPTIYMEDVKYKNFDAPTNISRKSVISKNVTVINEGEKVK